MKVLYDHQAFGQKIGGVSRSYVELIKHLDPEIEVEIALKYSRNVYVKEILPHISYPFGSLYVPFKRRIINARNFKFSIDKLTNSTYDLFHATFDDSYFLPYLKSPFVITVHDLIPEHDPGKWPDSWLLNRRQIFKLANQIITVSQNTKNELLRFYPSIPEAKVTVIYHGYSLPSASCTSKENKNGNYILYVGTRGGYKNFNKFIEGIAPILIERKELKLICTGSKLTKKEKEFLSQYGILHKVSAKQVNDSTLQLLYKHALILVFPSLLEGFGMPILEAWGNDCPVALSDCSCLPEIAGDAALYFNPTESQSIREVVANILENEDVRNNLIIKGHQRVEFFSWETAAQKLEQVYRKA